MKKIILFLMISCISFAVYAIENIAGPSSVCVGATIQLTNATQNGFWACDNTMIANVSSSGTVKGIAGGTVKIIYTVGKSTMSKTIRVDLAPLPISGIQSVCVGNIISLNDATEDGIWSSSNNNIASIGTASGIVTGVASGPVIITYTANGCIITAKVTVNSTPTITGILSVCASATTTLSATPTHGLWASENSNAIIGSSTGIVTGVKGGTSNITYTASNSCTTTTIVTINASPTPVTGAAIYLADTTTLINTGTGTWSSGTIGIATVNSSTGVVKGLAEGTASITYTDLGCTATATVTVIPTATIPSFSLIGTLYSSLPYIVDDNPAGFTQTFIKANINRAEKKHSRKFLFFNNFYLEGYFTVNANSLHTYDTTSTKPISYVNRLDLYQYANVKINLHQNIFYIHTNTLTINPPWKTVVYLDVMESFLRTNITDSISKITSNVNSWLLGGNLTFQVFNDKNFANLPLALRLSGEVFWINPMTNAVNPDLNFQYGNRSDAQNQLNANKSMTVNPYPYYNLDAQVQFQISSPTVDTGTAATPAKVSNPTKNYLFLHVGYVSNFAGSNTSNYYNNYLTAQIGVSIDIISSIQNYKKPSK